MLRRALDLGWECAGVCACKCVLFSKEVRAGKSKKSVSHRRGVAVHTGSEQEEGTSRLLSRLYNSSSPCSPKPPYRPTVTSPGSSEESAGSQASLWSPVGRRLGAGAEEEEGSQQAGLL